MMTRMASQTFSLPLVQMIAQESFYLGTQMSFRLMVRLGYLIPSRFAARTTCFMGAVLPI